MKPLRRQKTPNCLILFARLGWMKRYDGSAPDDIGPIGGGRYNAKHKGNELFNFHNHKGSVYGFIQPSTKGKPRQINLSRIAKGHTGAKLRNVQVIFVAKLHGKGPQVVVGWYVNATLYQNEQSKNKASHGPGKTFFAQTKSRNACLLKEPFRNSFKAPRGTTGLGQANISYPLDNHGRKRKLSNLWYLLRRINSTRTSRHRLCMPCHVLRMTGRNAVPPKYNSYELTGHE